MNPICLQCGGTLQIIPGHRSRQYCSDRCKQTAYRRRHGKKARPTKHERELDKVVRRIAAIKLRWPNFEFGTYYLLQEIQSKYGDSFTIKVAEAIIREINQALSNRNTHEGAR